MLWARTMNSSARSTQHSRVVHVAFYLLSNMGLEGARWSEWKIILDFDLWLINTYLYPAWRHRSTDKHFRLSDRKMIRAAIWRMRTQWFRTCYRVRQAQAIDFCAPSQRFGRLRISKYTDTNWKNQNEKNKQPKEISLSKTCVSVRWGKHTDTHASARARGKQIANQTEINHRQHSDTQNQLCSVVLEKSRPTKCCNNWATECNK